MTKEDKELIGIKEVAKILHVNNVTLPQRITDGFYDIPFSRIGNKFIFRRKDVEDYFEKSFKLAAEHAKEKDINKKVPKTVKKEKKTKGAFSFLS